MKTMQIYHIHINSLSRILNIIQHIGLVLLSILLRDGKY